ncbi:unnamed protein product [Spirodela intermedia]|uniref:Uncharacterized protein n=1 Tax=Spirodela intermedia TaxID=51605 RepID=A0A7I8IMM5_SPIIN|nr:unnamed protein product [Spirodela intermedia]CAA6659049.1 unnamed protein product [Spirodela intermedia]
MGRPPCCDKSNVRRGLWTAEEDKKIVAYVSTHGAGNWASVPKKAGLKRCGKSCRLRWTNYLRPDLKHDDFTPGEEQTIISLHAKIGSRWSIIAHQLPGRTDNDVKNYWNTKLKKKLIQRGSTLVDHAVELLPQPARLCSFAFLPQPHAGNNRRSPSDFSWTDLTPQGGLPTFPFAEAPPLRGIFQDEGGEICGGTPAILGEDDGDDHRGASSPSDINSFVESLLSRDDEMMWAFPEFLNDPFVCP